MLSTPPSYGSLLRYRPSSKSDAIAAAAAVAAAGVELAKNSRATGGREL
jgi:hypothetical protein